MAEFSKEAELHALDDVRQRIDSVLEGAPFQWSKIERKIGLASLSFFPPDPRDPDATPKVVVRAVRPEIYDPSHRIHLGLIGQFDSGPVIIEDTDGGQHKTRVVFEEGVPIEPLIAPDVPPPPFAAGAVFRAGEPCLNFAGRNWLGHGTIGAVLKQFKYRRGTRFSVEFNHDPANGEFGGLISNNHVIAQSDLGVASDFTPPGDPILGSRYYDEIGNLKGFVPLGDPNIHIDLAVAALNSQVYPTDTSQNWGAIYGSPGKLSGFAAVPASPIGTAVSKSGSSSDFTSGQIESSTMSINVRGRVFNDVYQVSKGFGTYGDSGSLVLQDDGDGGFEAIGMLSWGDSDFNIHDRKLSYFWPFVHQPWIDSELSWRIDGEILQTYSP